MGVTILDSIKELSLKDYSYSLDKSQILEEKKNDVSFVKTDALNGVSFTVNRFYEIDDRLFAYISDNFIYEITSLNAIKVCQKEFIKEPKLVKVRKKGAKDVLIVSNDYAYLIDSKQTTNATYGDYYVFTTGRLFVAKDSTIYVSKPYPFDEDVEILFYDEEIALDEKYGKIIGLFNAQNKIDVFTEKAIFSLKIIGDSYEYSLEKIQTFYVDILECSVKKIGDYIYFLSKGQLYVYKNGKVEIFVKLSETRKIIKAYAFLENYVLAYENQEEFYAVSTLDKEIKVINNFDVLIGNYAYKKEENALYKIALDGQKENTEKIKNQLVLDFSTAKTKAIVEMEIFSKGSVELKITGDFGERVYCANSPSTIISCNLASKRFNLSFSKNSQTPEKISIKYRIYGE